jgi:hypothetical protein
MLHMMIKIRELHHADGADCRRAGRVHLAGPVPGGVTAFPAFPARERSCPPGRQPIEKIMARCRGVRRCAGAIREGDFRQSSLTRFESCWRTLLCGIAAKERLLDVDHIIPRSRDGKTELANLRALSSKCNRSKRNQDDTDFNYVC